MLPESSDIIHFGILQCVKLFRTILYVLTAESLSLPGLLICFLSAPLWGAGTGGSGPGSPTAPCPGPDEGPTAERAAQNVQHACQRQEGRLGAQARNSSSRCSSFWTCF